MRRIAAFAVLALALSGCGGGSATSPEHAADADVCAYFAPTAFGMDSNAGALQVNGSIFSGQDDVNASPDLWGLVTTWQYDAHRYGSYLDPQMEQDALKDLTAIRTWCKSNGYGG
jgi:hypothetical protein